MLECCAWSSPWSPSHVQFQASRDLCSIFFISTKQYCTRPGLPDHGHFHRTLQPACSSIQAPNRSRLVSIFFDCSSNIALVPACLGGWYVNFLVQAFTSVIASTLGPSEIAVCGQCRLGSCWLALTMLPYPAHCDVRIGYKPVWIGAQYSCFISSNIALVPACSIVDHSTSPSFSVLSSPLVLNKVCFHLKTVLFYSGSPLACHHVSQVARRVSPRRRGHLAPSWLDGTPFLDLGLTFVSGHTHNGMHSVVHSTFFKLRSDYSWPMPFSEPSPPVAATTKQLEQMFPCFACSSNWASVLE